MAGDRHLARDGTMASYCRIRDAIRHRSRAAAPARPAGPRTTTRRPSD